MGAKIGSFLATLLLSIPLAAVGLMAIFGVPQFTPVIASSAGQRILRGGEGEAPGWNEFAQQAFDGTQSPAPASGAASWASVPSEAADGSGRNALWPPAVSTAPGAVNATRVDAPPAGWGQPPNPPAAVNTASATSSPLQTVMTPASAPGTSAAIYQTPPASIPGIPAEPGAAITFNWRQASLKLAELGIDQYHVERGSQEGTFLFVCVYAPADAPQVKHRFEAEAADPLQAVNVVLRQIDAWLQQRFAASNFPTRPASLTLSNGNVVR